MFTLTNNNSKLCLLLKTLLILLCIYIKRVTAAPSTRITESTNATNLAQCLKPKHEVRQIIAYEGETSVEIHCPISEAIQTKDEIELMKKTFNNSSKIHQFEKELKAIKRRIKNSTRVIWLKEGEPVHRENGNLILKQLVTDNSEAVLTLLIVGQTDGGDYTCLLNYTNPPKESCKYFNLSPAFNFNLRINSVNDYVPDLKPTISHPPADKVVRRGENVTFECKKKSTLSHQVTYWFKSNCKSVDDRACIEQFLDDFRACEHGGSRHLIDRYLFADVDLDELILTNVTERDIGYYGCLVENNKGFDIRLGHLNLLEVEFQRSKMIHDSITPIDNDGATTESHPSDKSSTDIQRTSPQTQTAHASLNGDTISPRRNLYTSINTSDNSIANLTVAHSREQLNDSIFNSTIIIGMVGLVFFLIIIGCFVSIHLKFVHISKGKKNDLHSQSAVVGNKKNTNGKVRQHLPSAECPDIYNIGKTSDGIITGLLAQNNGQFMSESVCSRLLHQEKDPSISSNSNSDEASSWSKSMSSQGDNSRAFYLHTSNTTTTTVPLYDHPPSTGATRLRQTMVHDACVINPTYGRIIRKVDSGASDWSFPRRNLERLNKIGEGQFGEVWRYIARQKDGSDNLVAVKQLKNRAGLGDRERLELCAEIEIMKLVNNHPNVIKLLNYCEDEYEPLLLIMEYAENGKLQTYLRNCRSYRKSYFYLVDFGSMITSKELVKFSYHIAKGMEYVASQGIIHRDLASRNILVNKDMVCKVADFGFARRVNDECAYERSTANPVPVKWMAPEALVENKFTTKSDVFSFGILMWEIVTLGATPYESMASSEVYKKVTSGGRLEKPAHCKEEFYQIMASCWIHDPAKRPTFKVLAAQLEQLLLSENDYIELDQYPEHAYYNILNTAEKEVVHLNDSLNS